MISSQVIESGKRLLSRKQAAEYLGISVRALAVWACTGRYRLPFVKVGRLAKYRLDDLEAFIARRTVGGEAA
jgi:excisionase family DNA binding protein